MTLIVVQSLFQLLIPVNLLSINMEANRHEINLFYTDLFNSSKNSFNSAFRLSSLSNEMLVVLKSVAESREDSAHFHTNPKLSYGFIFSRSSGTHEKLTFPFPVLFPRDIIFYYHINASTRFKFPS